MAKLKIVDEAKAETLYQDLANGLGEKRRMLIGNNTWLLRLSPHVIAVELHGTNVVVVWDDGLVEYDSGGWSTPTTVNRMNSVAHKFGLRVSRSRGWVNLIDVKTGEVVLRGL